MRLNWKEYCLYKKESCNAKKGFLINIAFEKRFIAISVKLPNTNTLFFTR